MINPIKSLRKENRIIISINADKMVTKIQYKSMKKILKKLEVEGTFLKNPSANIILYSERMNAFLLRLRTR